MSVESVENLNKYFREKSEYKQNVYNKTVECFGLLKTKAKDLFNDLEGLKEKQGHTLDLRLSEQGAYEMEMRFSGDALCFQMHTNVFSFPQDHFINNTDLVKKDKNQGYVGMILIYNFLADSLRYNRITDVGYLLGRIFLNADGHFYVNGRRQFSFLFQDFEMQRFNEEAASLILETAIKQAIDFDLYVPPFDQVKEVSLHQKNLQQGNTAIKTGKRLGFDYDSKDN